MRIYDGRPSFYQWDTNQKITSDQFKAGDEIHLFNMKQPNALVVLAYELDNKIVVDVPNILLQKSYPIIAYRVYVDDDGKATIEEHQFEVNQRPKPEDYVYTETEVLNYSNLNDRLTTLENNGVSPELVNKLVSEYLSDNPIIESDPTVPDWAKQPDKPIYTADEVGAIAQTELHAAVDTALAEAKASGAFDGAPGADGQDGTTPTIGDNGNWYIDDTDTGKPSRGEIGPAGADGATGADGKSAYQFAVDGGYTGTEEELAAKLAAEMPTALPNPSALTFTGAVTGSYDGSEPLEVVIPSGGGGASGMTLLGEIDCSAVSGNIEFTDLDNYTEFYLTWDGVKNGGTTASGYGCKINNIMVTSTWFVPIRTTSVSYGWSYAKYNGLVWMCQNSAGSTWNTNLTFNSENGAGQYNHVLNVGKAMSMSLSAPLSQYQSVSGTIKVYGR